MDNGSCYMLWKFRKACRESDIKHKRTRPCHPQTNGKAELFIRNSLERASIRENACLFVEADSVPAGLDALLQFPASLYSP